MQPMKIVSYQNSWDTEAMAVAEPIARQVARVALRGRTVMAGARHGVQRRLDGRREPRPQRGGRPRPAAGRDRAYKLKRSKARRSDALPGNCAIFARNHRFYSHSLTISSNADFTVHWSQLNNGTLRGKHSTELSRETAA